MDVQAHDMTAPGAASLCPVAGAMSDPTVFFHPDLYRNLASAQAAGPVFYSPEIDHWVVTRYRDVLAVLQDPASFSARNASTRFTPLHEDALRILQEGDFTPETTQGSMDPPQHTKIRAATNPLLN